ncbi:unnamed protein product [Vicia faba]|uniref:Uncharacterized protein n=1 Tax=Vicia faba TaxID=3906 RepID=A0AAV1BA79_VICFA|nr:unnamed protein product [Vicia faba]
MQELGQWKEHISHLLNVANDYIREVPSNQLYTAAAIAVFTTLIILLLCYFKHARLNTIVLIGLSESGKLLSSISLRMALLIKALVHRRNQMKTLFSS